MGKRAQKTLRMSDSTHSLMVGWITLQQRATGRKVPALVILNAEGEIKKEKKLTLQVGASLNPFHWTFTRNWFYQNEIF